jgi:hypothetical protein
MSPATLAALARNPRTRHLPEVQRGLAIPMGGVIVRKKDVLNHRYLAAHGLPHSPTMAGVFIGR